MKHLVYCLQKRHIQYSHDTIEKRKRKLEEEKEEFKRQTEAAMVAKMREQQKTMEDAMSRKIEELETKMKEMKATSPSTPTGKMSQSPKPPPVRIFYELLPGLRLSLVTITI